MQATRDPNVPDNNTGIILSIIPVLILVIIYYSSSIENCSGTGIGPGGRARKSKQSSLV